MATLAELKAVRQEFNKLPLLYQGEVFNIFEIFDNNKNNLKSPNNINDVKIELMKGAMKLWNGGAVSRKNILDLFTTFNDPSKFLDVCLDNLTQLKNTNGFNSPYYLAGYIQRTRGLPYIYDDFDSEINQLTMDKKTAETNLKTANETIVELNKRPNITLTDFQKLQENQEKHTEAEINKLNEIKDAYNELVDYWNKNDDFKTFFNNKLLNLDGLGEVKKLIKLAKKVKEIEDYWLSIDFVNQFGEISVESIGKIKGKLDELKTWTDAFVSLTPQTVKEKYNEPKEAHTDYDKIKGELDNYIGILKIIDPDEKKPSSETFKQWTTNKITEVYKKNEEIGKKDDEIAKLKGEITELKKQPEEHLSKLIKTYKEQIAEETEMFYQSLDLDEVDDIRPEYVGNYLKNLGRVKGETDPNNVINGFKLTVLAIATEKAKKISDEWINKPIAQEPQFRKTKIEYFNRILRQWEIHWGLNPTLINNPLWIVYDKDKKDYRQIIRDLLIKWWVGTPRTRNLPNPMLKATIELDTFPINKTSFGLLREVLNRRSRMTDYIQDWKELSPQVKSVVEAVETEHTDRLNSLSTETQYTSFQIYFDYFNKRNSILNEVKPVIIKNLTELFKENEKDGEIRKFLKQVASEQFPSWEAQVNIWPAGVAGLLFMAESMEEFYLGHLIIHIRDNLNIAEPVKFEEIKEPLKKILTDKPNGIFTILYSGFTSTDKQRDLDDFEKGINRKLKEIETLIDNTRNNKKNEEHQAKDKQYLTKLLEVYKQQITKETKTFYSVELGLDESENINPKYWGNEGTEEEPDNEKSYLEKLKEKEFNGDSEPQQIINAFKFITLISATERAVKNSDNLKKEPKVFNNKKIRASTLKEFTKIKEKWDELKGVEPNKENNPLFISQELDKVNLGIWKDKLNEIIQIWQ